MTKCNLQQPIFTAATKFTFKETKDGFFIEAFLISDRVNANNWMVTRDANVKDGQDFVGKPDIVFVNDRGQMDHTTGETLEDSLKVQEPFRKGTIKVVKGTDTGRKLTTVSKIEDPETIRKIKSKEIEFVSPAIFPKSLEDVQVVQTGPNTHMHIVNRYNALHRAFVSEPAYGTIEADIGGTCEGDGKDCMVKLQQIQAQIDTDNIEPLREIPLVKIKTSKCSETGKLIFELPAGELNDLVSQCLSEKLGPGEEPTDQDVAICFDEARKKLKESEAKASKSATASSNKADNASKSELGSQEETDKKVKELESKAQEVEKELKAIKTAQEETEKEKKEAQEKEEEEKAQEEEEEKKNGKKGRKGQDEMTEKEKKEEAKRAQEEEEKKEEELTSKIASELSVKIPLVDQYVKAKVAQKSLDEKATAELRDTMLKASIDDIKSKLDDIGPFIAMQKSQENISEIGYGNDGAFTGSSNLDNKSSEELLEELEA